VTVLRSACGTHTRPVQRHADEVHNRGAPARPRHIGRLVATSSECVARVTHSERRWRRIDAGVPVYRPGWSGYGHALLRSKMEDFRRQRLSKSGGVGGGGAPSGMRQGLSRSECRWSDQEGLGPGKFEAVVRAWRRAYTPSLQTEAASHCTAYNKSVSEIDSGGQGRYRDSRDLD